MNRTTFQTIFFTLLLTLGGATTLLAQTNDAVPVPEEGMHAGGDRGQVSRVTSEVSQEVYSPFCPGKTLAMCPSPSAAEVRREIQDMAREGLSKEEIKDRVVAEYGEEFRLVEPPASDNFGLFGAIAVGLGLAFFAVWFISRRRRDDTPEAAADETPDEEPETDDDNLEESDPYVQELRDTYRD